MLKNLQGKGHETSLSKGLIKQLRKIFMNSILLKQEQIPNMWQKKSKVTAYKTKSGDDRKSQHIVVHSQKNQVTHFIHVQNYVIPPLKTVHAYPGLYPKFVTDAGALKFIMNGANIMSPGLTNKQSYMDDVAAETIVAIYAAGHEHALAIGVTTQSTESIKTSNEGIGVNTIHYVGDGFWNLMYKK